MANKLSFTQINTYTTCGYKYYNHYVRRYRSKYFHAALAFGSAIDDSLNTLLETRDLDKALQAFEKKWAFQYVNGKMVALSNSEIIVYANADLDEELLQEEDILKLNEAAGNRPYYELLELIKSRKDQFGWANLDVEEQQFFNYVNWLSLRRKGHVMLKSYNEKVMPKIKKVLAVQHKTALVNQDGDEVTQILDLVVEWEDGSILLMDNKTSARQYDEDSASTSQQLISYYHKAKVDFGVNAVGFLVMNKAIQKNKIKICSKCGYDGSESRAKTCDQEHPGMVVKRGKEVEGMVRCNGDWNVTINPECFIQVIINTVTPEAEDLVLSTFDEANNGIKSENYYKNLNACKNGSIICPFYNLCWKGDDSELVKLEESKKVS